jgi:hypothetical protein
MKWQPDAREAAVASVDDGWVTRAARMILSFCKTGDATYAVDWC